MSRAFNLNQLIAQIAHEELSIPTLAVRNRDLLDFHDFSVWAIERALRRAYLAGLSRRISTKPTRKPRRTS